MSRVYSSDQLCVTAAKSSAYGSTPASKPAPFRVTAPPEPHISKHAHLRFGFVVVESTVNAITKCEPPAAAWETLGEWAQLHRRSGVPPLPAVQPVLHYAVHRLQVLTCSSEAQPLQAARTGSAACAAAVQSLGARVTSTQPHGHCM